MIRENDGIVIIRLLSHSMIPSSNPSRSFAVGEQCRVTTLQIVQFFRYIRDGHLHLVDHVVMSVYLIIGNFNITFTKTNPPSRSVSASMSNCLDDKTFNCSKILYLRIRTLTCDFG